EAMCAWSRFMPAGRSMSYAGPLGWQPVPVAVARVRGPAAAFPWSVVPSVGRGRAGLAPAHVDGRRLVEGPDDDAQRAGRGHDCDLREPQPQRQGGTDRERHEADGQLEAAGAGRAAIGVAAERGAAGRARAAAMGGAPAESRTCGSLGPGGRRAASIHGLPPVQCSPLVRGGGGAGGDARLFRAPGIVRPPATGEGGTGGGSGRQAESGRPQRAPGGNYGRAVPAGAEMGHPPDAAGGGRPRGGGQVRTPGTLEAAAGAETGADGPVGLHRCPFRPRAMVPPWMPQEPAKTPWRRSRRPPWSQRRQTTVLQLSWSPAAQASQTDGSGVSRAALRATSAGSEVSISVKPSVSSPLSLMTPPPGRRASPGGPCGARPRWCRPTRRGSGRS